MQKRIMALLLALCLSLTCTLGALAEDLTPEEDTGANGQLTGVEIATGVDAEQEENTSDGANSQNDSSEGSPEEGDDANSEEYGIAPTASEGGAAAVPDEQQGISDEERELREKVCKFDVYPYVYDATGTQRADMDNIAVGDVLTVYYAIFYIDANRTYTECTPEKVTEVLGTTNWAINCGLGNSSTAWATLGEIEETTQALLPDDADPYRAETAYWKQTLEPTATGSIDMSHGLRAQMADGTWVGYTVGGSGRPFTVREESFTPAARKLSENLNRLWVSRVDPGVDPIPAYMTPQVDLGDVVTLALYGDTADGPIDNVSEFVSSLGLDPEELSIKWTMTPDGLLGGYSSFIFGAENAAGEFAANRDPAGSFGSKSFTASVSGTGAVTFALYYDGNLVKTAGAVNYKVLRQEQIAITPENFPDENLRKALAANEDKDGDGSIDAGITGLTLSGCGITSLKGLEKFEDLISLDVTDNALTELDLSAFKNLRWLECHGNQLKTLNVSGNPAISYLCCMDNQLTELDLRNNRDLWVLFCANNQLAELDLSNNRDLRRQGCQQLVEATYVVDGDAYVITLPEAVRGKDITVRSDVDRTKTYEVQDNKVRVPLGSDEQIVYEIPTGGPATVPTLFVTLRLRPEPTPEPAPEPAPEPLPMEPVIPVIPEESGIVDSAAAGAALQAAVAQDPALSALIQEHAAGKTVTAELVVSEPAQDADLNALAKILPGKNAVYKDISISVKADGEELGKLTQLDTPVEFALDLPADAGPIAIVLRQHGNTVDRLPCRVENGKVYFSTDKFSIYAIGSTNDLAYADVQTIADQAYTGKAVEPAVTVTINGAQTLVQGEDYEVSYTDNVAPGTATATIVGKGRFAGTVTMPFTIAAPVVDAHPDIAENKDANGDWHHPDPTPAPAAAAPAAYHGSIPQTADEFPLAGAVAVFGVSLLGLGALVLLRKKQK